MKNDQAQTPQNLALTKIVQKFTETSDTPEGVVKTFKGFIYSFTNLIACDHE